MMPTGRTMSVSAYRKRHTWPAPCTGARRLLAVAIILTGLAVLTVAVGLAHGPAGRYQPAAAWMRMLSLSAPALWTPGSPMRHPEMVHPGVDLRFTVSTEIVP